MEEERAATTTVDDSTNEEGGVVKEGERHKGGRDGRDDTRLGENVNCTYYLPPAPPSPLFKPICGRGNDPRCSLDRIRTQSN